MSPTRAASASQPATIQINTAPPPPAPPEKPERAAEHEEKPPRWFWDQIAEIPTNDWGRIWSLELHRREPAVPGQPGAKGYLTLYNAPVTMGDIKAAYGGGKFRLNLCKNGRWTTSHDFDVEGTPKYDLTREAPAANGNGNGHGSDVEILRMLQAQIEKLTNQLLEMRNSGQSDGTNKAVEVVADGAKQVIKMVTDHAVGNGGGSSDPTRQLDAVLAAADRIAGMRAPAGGGLGDLGPLLKPILEKLADKLLSPPDPLAELTKLGAILDVLEKIRGGGGGGGGKSDWRTALVEEGIPAARDLITTIASNRDANMRIATEQRAAAEARERTASTVKDLQAQRAAAAHAPATIQPTAPAPPAPAVGARPFRVVPIGDEPAAPEAAAAAAPASIQVNADEYLNGVKLRFVDLLRAGDDYEFIVDFLEGSGIELVTYLTQYTPAQIKLYCSQDPILAHAVALPRWDEFIEVARAYLEGELAEPPRAN